jgi:hypothetical protein
MVYVWQLTEFINVVAVCTLYILCLLSMLTADMIFLVDVHQFGCSFATCTNLTSR